LNHGIVVVRRLGSVPSISAARNVQGEFTMKRFTGALAACAVFVALAIVPATAGSANKLRIENENSSSITLNTSSPGFCGTFVSASTGGAPPSTVAANSFSTSFSLVTSGCSGGINVATFQYIGSNGELVAQCTYSITGNDTFTFSASPAPPCKVVFDPAGFTDFVFPSVGSAGKRPTKTIHLNR
jgi:hypothetical protein